jgi:hypothetical protein
MKYIIVGLLIAVAFGYTIYTSETLEVLNDAALWESCMGSC